MLRKFGTNVLLFLIAGIKDSNFGAIHKGRQGVGAKLPTQIF